MVAAQQVQTLLAPRDAKSGQIRQGPGQGQASSPKVAGDGQSLYSGTVPLETTQSGSGFQLKDPTRGNTYTDEPQRRHGQRRLAR